MEIKLDEPAATAGAGAGQEAWVMARKRRPCAWCGRLVRVFTLVAGYVHCGRVHHGR